MEPLDSQIRSAISSLSKELYEEFHSHSDWIIGTFHINKKMETNEKVAHLAIYNHKTDKTFEWFGIFYVEDSDLDIIQRSKPFIKSAIKKTIEKYT